MRFGLQIPNFIDGAPGALFDEVVERASAAEESGYDSVWVMDHFFQLPPMGGPSQPMLDAYTLLGALAARTSEIRLGALVSGVTYRNPAHLAKIVTTLDVISAGRAILGIGAAWYDVEHDGLGFDFPPAGERLDRLEEALQICRAMFAGTAPSFEGTYYRTHEAHNIPPPVQRGGPSILVGGGGEKRTLRLVAQYADMCNLFGDAATIAHKVDVLHRHCDAIGRDPSEITISRLATLVLTENEQETVATTDFLRQVTGEEPSGSNVGTSDELVAQVDELAASGVDYFIFNMPTGTADTVRRVGDALVARFAD
ncbi:MAG TPA: LLM class F420-dependent oxidoreductase [Acidimicrobiales bacterium]|jgi:F420-dependent oxidoreductase-like protein|nr:LLM class F420-dependent oxidoreductase [Acidimicrobiales bacterium]